MARIGADSLIVRGERRRDGTWLFTVRYIVHFESAEFGMRFDDSVQIAVNGTATPVAFIACARSVLRKKRVVVADGALLPPSGGDDLYARVRVRRRGGADAVTQSARLLRISAQSVGTRPLGPGTVSSDGRLTGGARSGPS
ncbi:hypothetical protein ACXDF8_15650 [Mycolicibacterium sp. CBM1]